VNRTQQFCNIPNRLSGSVRKSLPERTRILRERHYAEGSPIFHFPSEKGDFCNVTPSFFALRDQNNFHIFRDPYQRSPLDRHSGEGGFGC
jgi:hypothetical protein